MDDLKYHTFYRVLVEPQAGTHISQIALEAYLLQVQLGIPVQFTHNKQQYSVHLDWRPVGKEE